MKRQPIPFEKNLPLSVVSSNSTYPSLKKTPEASSNPLLFTKRSPDRYLSHASGYQCLRGWAKDWKKSLLWKFSTNFLSPLISLSIHFLLGNDSFIHLSHISAGTGDLSDFEAFLLMKIWLINSLLIDSSTSSKRSVTDVWHHDSCRITILSIDQIFMIILKVRF